MFITLFLWQPRHFSSCRKIKHTLYMATDCICKKKDATIVFHSNLRLKTQVVYCLQWPLFYRTWTASRNHSVLRKLLKHEEQFRTKCIFFSLFYYVRQWDMANKMAVKCAVYIWEVLLYRKIYSVSDCVILHAAPWHHGNIMIVVHMM